MKATRWKPARKLRRKVRHVSMVAVPLAVALLVVGWPALPAVVTAVIVGVVAMTGDGRRRLYVAAAVAAALTINNPYI